MYLFHKELFQNQYRLSSYSASTFLNRNNKDYILEDIIQIIEVFTSIYGSRTNVGVPNIGVEKVRVDKRRSPKRRSGTNPGVEQMLEWTTQDFWDKHWSGHFINKTQESL